MILGLVRWGSRVAVPALAFIFVREIAEPGTSYSTGWRIVFGILLGAAIVTAIVTWDPVLKFARGGATLVAGDFIEDRRDVLGGPDLQVIGVEIYNERESGGEGRTARDVVPHVEAFKLDGERVVGHRGVWFPDAKRDVPSTVTFRPTHEKHALELVAKFPDGRDAWLAGEQDPPSLTPGIYEVRVTLRGDNLRPTRRRFYVRNPGAGEQLTVATKQKDLAPIPEVSSPSMPDPKPDDLPEAGAEAEAKASEPAPDREPLEDPHAEIDALLGQVPDLERLLWQRVKQIRRSGGLNMLGTEVLGEVQAWNRRVLRLADEYLPLKEAALVDAIGGMLTIMVSADRVETLLQRNSEVLRKIRKIVEDGRVIEKKN